jgi:hypothetical protein
MTLEYAQHLGGLVANFQSMEFALRAVLQDLPNVRPIGVINSQDLYLLPVGHDLPENELTSYDSLGTLIHKYNQEARNRRLTEIDLGLVEVRDALARGRISAKIPSDTLRLIKFSKPKDGRVKITFNALLSEDWFLEQKRRTREALKALVESHWPQ